MRQLTLRVSDELVAQMKALAQAQGRSLNGWANSILGAAADPDLAGDDAARTRERLARAGLLMQPKRSNPPPARPDPEELDQARAAAGKGKSLSDLVSEDRG